MKPCAGLGDSWVFQTPRDKLVLQHRPPRQILLAAGLHVQRTRRAPLVAALARYCDQRNLTPNARAFLRSLRVLPVLLLLFERGLGQGRAAPVGGVFIAARPVSKKMCWQSSAPRASAFGAAGEVL